MGYNLKKILKNINSFAGKNVYAYTLSRGNGEEEGGTISFTRRLESKSKNRFDYHTEILYSIDYPVPEYPGRESTFSQTMETYDASHSFIARVCDDLITYSSQITYPLPKEIYEGETCQYFWASSTTSDGIQLGGIQVELSVAQIGNENFFLYIEKEFDVDNQLLSTATDYFPVDQVEVNAPTKVTIEYSDKEFLEMNLLKIQ